MDQGEMQLAELVRHLVSESYEPAVILVTVTLECRYSSGPLSRYLRLDPAGTSPDLLGLVGPEMGIKLREIIRLAHDEGRRVVVSQVQASHSSRPFSIDVRPVTYNEEKLYMVCIADQSHVEMPALESDGVSPARNPDAEAQADSHRAERSSASNVSDNASLSSAGSLAENTSMLVENELESLGDELFALSAQLHAARERRRVRYDDLRNLYDMTGVEAVFLDANMNIRSITPGVASHLGVTEDDLGKPLSALDLPSFGADLLRDVQAVLKLATPIERTIETADARSCTCRVHPYRTRAGTVAGVVLTLSGADSPELAVGPWGAPKAVPPLVTEPRTGAILIIEDNSETSAVLEQFLKDEGHTVTTARDKNSALQMIAGDSIRPDLILADYRLLHSQGEPGITMELEDKFLKPIPMIVMVGDASVHRVWGIAFDNCVQLNRPIRAGQLVELIQRQLPQERDDEDKVGARTSAIESRKQLTARQHQILNMVLDGSSSKNIAVDLGISKRTVDSHRAEIMRKMGARSIPALVRMALAATPTDEDETEDPDGTRQTQR